MKPTLQAIFSIPCIGVIVSFAITGSVFAQPYIDPLQVRYMYAFPGNNSSTTPFTHIYVGSDLGLKLGENTYGLFSPFYEQWSIDSAEQEQYYPVVRSIAFPVGLIIPLGESKWTLTAVPIFRWNGEELFAPNTFQFGGVTFASYARKPMQKFRIGVYMNSEFFGLFVIPLIGADWRIDDKNYLFGLLPGRLTYEHKWTEKFYGGITFRAPTNSYRLSTGQYIRLDDNQLSGFLDFYLTKHVCVTLEGGMGILRRIRTGIEGREYLTDEKWGDGPFVKISAAYRIRFE